VKDIITVRAPALVAADPLAANHGGAVAANALRVPVRNATPCGTRHNRNAAGCTPHRQEKAHSSPADHKDGAQLLCFLRLRAYPRTAYRCKGATQLRSLPERIEPKPAAGDSGSVADSAALAVAGAPGRYGCCDTSAGRASGASVVPPHGRRPSSTGTGDVLAGTIVHSLSADNGVGSTCAADGNGPTMTSGPWEA